MAISKPSPYIPSFLRAAMLGNRPLTLTWSDVADTNISSTSSFQYDPHSYALKSTQQLNVDWSQFQNHTFFMSAEAKVNLAFDAIINGYPFDGTRQEVEVFFEKLTGFDRWVFDRFPRWKGALQFTGSTYIQTQNKTGALFPELSKDASGKYVLNPTGSNSMTIEMQIFVPTGSNGTQVICGMSSSITQGFGAFLLATSNTTQAVALFGVVNDSKYMTVPVQLKKGSYNHVAFVFNKDDGLPYLESFIDGTSQAKSATKIEIGDMDIDGAYFMIGAGGPLKFGPTTIVPTETLNATIDEFRVFHSARSSAQQKAYARKSIFATSDLVLYYRFNEPSGSLDGTWNTTGINAIVLDSSGNSLHALIKNFNSGLRVNASLDDLNPMVYEHPDTTVVLFPAYPAIVELNTQLLASASAYDQANPNLITKLVPQHYLLEGAIQDGFNEPEGTAGQAYAGTGIPGQGQMGNSQIMVSLLYIWARFFDDLKLFVDAFSTLRTVDYETHDTVPDTFLFDLVKNFGFHLPPLFNDATLEQYIRGENIDIQEITTNKNALRHVQNTLLRRVLINLPDVIKSKGTQHSIKSFLRAVGIDPGNNVRIREFGGPTTQQLAFSREKKLEPGTMVQFFDGYDVNNNLTGSLVLSPYLTASVRNEPGYPYIKGAWVNGVSNNVNDRLLTSGSWTWEAIVKYTPASVKMMTSATQSLARFCVIGGDTLFGNGNFGDEAPYGFNASLTKLAYIANLVAISSSVDPRLVLYVRPNDAHSSSLSISPLLQMTLPMPLDGGIFNGDKWNVSFGCQRGDDGLDSPVSSSYFLRLAYQNDGEIQYIAVTSSFFEESPYGGHNAFRELATQKSVFGPFIAIGAPDRSRNQIIQASFSSSFLNTLGAVPDEARVTNFNGRMSNMRFWSKALSVEEWQEHVRNYNSTGVEDPLVNWNYVHTRSGSFGRLRINSLVRQEVRRAVATGSSTITGTITFLDFSENNLHMTGTNFPCNQDVVVGEIFDLSYLSPYFDEAATVEKIRVRSYLDQNLVNSTPWAMPAPVYELVKSEQPTDDVRFIIEFSLIDALNRDIITMFSTLDAMDNALGAPELMFSPDYPDLERMRNIYFNRIKEKLNFQAFLEFFRWFDASIGIFIQQLIPRKTHFKGTNFTIESHMLERAKQEYLFNEMYLGDNIRQNLDARILLQQIIGTIRKY